MTETDATVFTFGKYRGTQVADVPTAYLRWCLRECEGLDEELAFAIRAELEHRQEARTPAESACGTHPGVEAWKAAWRTIVKLGHPDRGGDEELFKVLNGINDAMNGKE